MPNVTQQPDVKYLRVVDWSDHLHPDLTRKVKPPFRWIKLQSENLDMLGDLTLREYGAYCRLLNLAALTNNRTIFNAKAIKRRTGITQKDIEDLQNRGLLRIINRTDAPEKDEQKQGNDSKTASDIPANSPQPAAPEGKGEDSIGSDLNRTDTSIPCTSCTPSDEKDSEEKTSKCDPRPFEDLKAEVKKMHSRLESIDCDDDGLWKYGGQSLHMTRNQFDECVKQLRQDGEI